MPFTTGTAHEPQFDADDPAVARLREICLDFPDVREESTWGRPNFRVSSRIFALAGAGRAAEVSVWFKPDPEERRALLQQSGFFEPAYFGPKGWLALDLPDIRPSESSPADTSPADTSPADTSPADTGPAGTGPADTSTVDWRFVAELCETSYRLIALKRQVARLDARQP